MSGLCVFKNFGIYKGEIYYIYGLTYEDAY